MDWNDLRHVLALARGGSLVAAARALGVEHTTVGRRIAAIERDLGARLFAKTPDGHRLTPAGEQAFAAGEAMERVALGLEAAIAGRDGRPEGTVRVTTSEGFTPVLIPHLARLYAEQPRIIVELLSANRTFDLSRGEADIAIRMVPTTSPDLVARRVSTTGWALFASPAYVARAGKVSDPEALAGHRLVGFDDPLGETPGGKWLAQHLQGSDVVIRGNSIPSIADAVAAGLGLSCLPCLTGDRDARLVRVSPVVASGVMWLVVHPERQVSARVRIVWDFLLEVIAAEAPLLTGCPRTGAPSIEPPK
ncbi:MAG: LysR family transcriptional regulator [Polyangiales bacterium]